MNRTLPLLLVLGALAAPASAQPLRVQDRDGNAVVLPEPGAVTLVQFMATWCAPCHEQTKALVELHQTYSARAFTSWLSRSTGRPSTSSCRSTSKSLRSRTLSSSGARCRC